MMAKRAPARRRPRKAKPGTRGFEPAECRLEQPEGSAADAADAIVKAGGCVVGQYKEPLGGHQTLLSILPIDKIEPRLALETGDQIFMPIGAGHIELAFRQPHDLPPISGAL